METARSSIRQQGEERQFKKDQNGYQQKADDSWPDTMQNGFNCE